MDRSPVKRRLTCILAADAVAYSRHTSRDEEGTLRVLAAHRSVIDGIIAFHDGRIVGTAGDSVLAEFSSPVEAVRCGVEIQDALRTRNEALPEERRLLFRIGINLGDVVVSGSDLLGDGVNIAARLESLADPGGVLIASSVYDQITGKLDLGFRDIGEQSLKNITHPVRAYKVSGSGGTVAAPAVPPPPARAPRRWPWLAAAAVAVAAIAGLFVAGGPTRRVETPPPVADSGPAAERARLQAEVAAAEKARLEAESRAVAADAEAVRARAEREAAELKAKAQSEAAAVRSKAEADAAAARARSETAEKSRQEALSRAGAADAEAMRARAERDASDAKAKAEPAVAAAAPQVDAGAATARDAGAGAAAGVPPVAPFNRASLDGRWPGRLECDAYDSLNAGAMPVEATAAAGVFTMNWGPANQPGSGHVEGRVSGSGKLTLRGTAVARSKRSFGSIIDVRFDGAVAPARIDLRGHVGQRTCTLALARPG